MTQFGTTSIAVGICLLALTPAAYAGGPTAADKLFDEGNALAAAGRYPEACPKLAESHRLEPAVGTQFNLADCYEHIGRTATAQSLFLDVARIARAAGKFERERIAKERAAILEAKLARLRIVVKASIPGLEIRLDGAPLPREAWSTPMAVDPGVHRVVASAPSRTPYEGTVTTVETVTSELFVPELVDPAPRPPATEEASPRSAQRTLALAAAGVGIVGVAVGSIAGLISMSSRGTAEGACPEGVYHFRCPTRQGADDWNSAHTAGGISTVGFAVGAVGLVGAAVLWFTASPSRARVGATATGLRFEGRF